jgi:crossover junction endodeoxyribonuclease RuvC
MIILGIDPGTATTGYGILDMKSKDTLNVIDYGLIETSKNGVKGERFLLIHRELKNLLKMYNPDVIAIEKLFFATNAKTAMSVGQAQGVMLFCAAQMKKEVIEYAPGTIKKAIAGSGRADKKLIQKSIRKILGNNIKSKKRARTHFDNAADALAVALTHVYLNGKSLKEYNNRKSKENAK